MKKYISWLYPLPVIALLVFACVEPFAPPNLEVDQNLLVVDALLNGSNGEVNVHLSRTIPLADKTSQRPELGASVSIETQSGSTYLLTDDAGDGHYFKSGISFLADDQYKLLITTSDGKKYGSDYITLSETPAIDSVNWKTNKDGIEIYVNTHDAANKTKYYRWEYTDTWAYASAFDSNFEFTGSQPVLRTDNINICYHNFNSSNILIKTTKVLSQDVVSEFPLVFLPKRTERLNIRYSILVKQYAITKDAYEFWDLLKKNTESLGGLFDPLPSQLTGNIQSLDDEQEAVLGYFSASKIAENRIFIEYMDLPQSHRFSKAYPECELDTVYMADLSSFKKGSNILVTTFGSPFPLGYLFSNNSCVDCRNQSGTNVKPIFW